MLFVEDELKEVKVEGVDNFFIYVISIMKTPRGYRRLPNGLLKKSTAGRRKRKAGGRKKRKQRGRGHKKGHKGGGVLGFAALRAAQAAPAVAKALGPYVMPVIGAAVAKGVKNLINKKKKGGGMRRHGGGLKRHGVR